MPCSCTVSLVVNMIKLSVKLPNLILKGRVLSNESFMFVGDSIVANRAGMGPRCFSEKLVALEARSIT